jgi:hypothetical protein
MEFDKDRILDEITTQDGTLYKSKPNTDGLCQFVWRMCQFHSGRNTCMPVMASHWLQTYLDQQGIDASVSGVLDDQGQAIFDELEGVTNWCLEQVGLSKYGAVRDWGGLLWLVQ